MIDVVLVIAAGLSVQSPFHRAAMREEQARVGINCNNTDTIKVMVIKLAC